MLLLIDGNVNITECAIHSIQRWWPVIELRKNGRCAWLWGSTCLMLGLPVLSSLILFFEDCKWSSSFCTRSLIAWESVSKGQIPIECFKLARMFFRSCDCVSEYSGASVRILSIFANSASVLALLNRMISSFLVFTRNRQVESITSGLLQTYLSACCYPTPS